jgi:hypothetical protein
MKAFPTTKPLDSWGDPNQGMDLRDYFAAKSMQGLLSNVELIRGHFDIAKDKNIKPINVLVEESYQIADAMMEARNVTK